MKTGSAVLLAGLLVVTGCAAPAPPPGAIQRSIDGVRVFERAGDGSDELIVQDAVEWRGRFRIESKCLQLSIDDVDYTPVFMNRPALRTALGDVGSEPPRLSASAWSLEGARVREEDRAGYAVVTAACAGRPFLVTGLSDPKPPPPAPRGAR